MTKDGADAVAIGRVGSAAGIKGEFRVNLYAVNSVNLKEGKSLLFRVGKSEPDGDRRPLFRAECEWVRYQKDKTVIKIEGVDDRNAAENIRGMEVCVEADDLDALPEGEHYVRNIIGCMVRDTSSRADIGILKDVIQNTAQSVLEVETPEGRIVLIPAVDAFMRSIDEEGRVIEVELIPGFI